MNRLATAVYIETQPRGLSCTQAKVCHSPMIESIQEASNQGFRDDLSRTGAQIGIKVRNVPVVPHLIFVRVAMWVTKVGLERLAKFIRPVKELLDYQATILHEWLQDVATRKELSFVE